MIWLLNIQGVLDHTYDNMLFGRELMLFIAEVFQTFIVLNIYWTLPIHTSFDDFDLYFKVRWASEILSIFLIWSTLSFVYGWNLHWSRIHCFLWLWHVHKLYYVCTYFIYGHDHSYALSSFTII